MDQIRYAIASGALKTDELLPSIRPLAEDLRINRNTVAKAYQRLVALGEDRLAQSNEEAAACSQQG